MISVEKARRLIRRNLPSLGIEARQLDDCLGFVLAEDILAPISLPLFSNAAMDGYVFRTRDIQKAAKENPVLLKIKGTIKAGDQGARSLRPFEAYRIMTGAPIPSQGGAVLPKEEAHVKANFLLTEGPVSRKHIHFAGEEIKKGTRVLKKGHPVSPATVGLLAALGIDKVWVFRQPRIGLIATGSELVQPGNALLRGTIYDSNAGMLGAALQNMGIRRVRMKTVSDRRAVLTKTLRRALRESDTVIIAGGVSVGEYDLVKDILNDLNVRTIFWQVSQKPGKPLFFGKAGGKLVFGLPGNPAAAFICFYEYIFPALHSMMGFSKPGLRRELLAIATDIKADERRTLFLKGRLRKGLKRKEVMPLGHQGSHMISSLCQADCLIVVPAWKRVIRKNEKLAVHFLP